MIVVVVSTHSTVWSDIANTDASNGSNDSKKTKHSLFHECANVYENTQWVTKAI